MAGQARAGAGRCTGRPQRLQGRVEVVGSLLGRLDGWLRRQGRQQVGDQDVLFGVVAQRDLGVDAIDVAASNLASLDAKLAAVIEPGSPFLDDLAACLNLDFPGYQCEVYDPYL